MPFKIVRDDITHMHVDAIVNAANTALARGGGVCGAIFEASAHPDLLEKECFSLAPIKTGEAVITHSYGLAAPWIIHAAGPVYWSYPPKIAEKLLASAYHQSLQIACDHHLESIAFPLISSGIYGFPKEKALEIACDTIEAFLDSQDYDLDVYLTVFGRAEFSLSQKIQNGVQAYIDDHYVDEKRLHDRRRGEMTTILSDDLSNVEVELSGAELPDKTKKFLSKFTKLVDRYGAPQEDEEESETTEELNAKLSFEYDDEAFFDGADGLPALGASAPANVDDYLDQMEEPFNVALLQLIDEKGKTDVEVYKGANIDRKLFSKIRSGKFGYTPRKPTILALAISLELTLEETRGLLERAGYALSHASKFDVIIEYFLVSRQYNIFEINEVLFQYDQPLLGS